MDDYIPSPSVLRLQANLNAELAYKLLDRKVKEAEKNELIRIKKIAAEQEENKNGMVRKYRKQHTCFRWFVCCPGCGKWSYLTEFKKIDNIYFCPKKGCTYEIGKDRIWKFS